jgi:hypothetical protein
MMPRYHFHLRSSADSLLEDEEGSEFRDDERAFAEARAAALELMSYALLHNPNSPPTHIPAEPRRAGIRGNRSGHLDPCRSDSKATGPGSLTIAPYGFGPRRL